MIPERWHVYWPASRRGEGSYPRKGAVALCGHVKQTDIRSSVSLDHPGACQKCLLELKRIEDEQARGYLA